MYGQHTQIKQKIEKEEGECGKPRKTTNTRANGKGKKNKKQK